MTAGHGHEHGHGHGKMELPDYRQWKIEGTPLETVQKKLAARGLRDPWARHIQKNIPEQELSLLKHRLYGKGRLNEAWRYMGGFAGNITFTSVILKGFKWGFAAFVVALGAEYFLESQNGDKKHH
ncbi:NADH dehydrogenase [Apodemus speciosus]|uniref:NADH dehydrogenase [ubiquinone] 1 beta subcomplex subunit 3 n=1 Tax=Apodemus speciosus TaxID=105296 RepID=A0ABQ0ED46_APOSI